MDKESGIGVSAGGRAMALKNLRRLLVSFGVLFVLVSPSAIYSCGPFLESAIFAFPDRPDSSDENFAVGKLGIVRPEFRPAYLIVAYRYFSGLKLNQDEQDAAQAVWDRNLTPEHPSADDAMGAWEKARSKIPNLPPPPQISQFANVSKDEPYFQYLSCPGDAFLNAARTLNDRSAKFPARDLLEWILGQDQVFSNCSGEVHVIPAVFHGENSLLRADRDYQIAAAHFYARDFDNALAEFDAIAQDRSSPWASVSPYLAARALVRKANLVHKTNEEFDRATMLEAQKRLEAILADPRGASIREPALRLLNYVRFRIEPDKRVGELDRMILQPAPGKNFKQDLWDYVVLLSHGQRADDPSEWVQTFQTGVKYSGGMREQTIKETIAKWQETKSLPWLIAALAVADTHSPNLSSLLASAKEIGSSSPGYLTVRYYALRLMIASGQADASRAELDSLLRRGDDELPRGSRNLLNEERLKLTTSFEDFLQHAAEMPVLADVDFNTGDMIPSDKPSALNDSPLFNHFAAEVLIKRLPLSLMIQAAGSPALPKNLRREIARTAWVRSVLIDDLDSAGRLQPLLQELDMPLWKTMEPFRSATDANAKHFAGLLVILNNPGMKPSVRESSLRTATLGEIDNYRDNWWCSDMNSGINWGQSYGEYNKDVNLKFVDHDPDFPFPVWLSDTQKAAARADWAKLTATGTAPNYLVGQVLAYAKQHPQEPQIPQALHLAVRSTRYGCTNVETSKSSKAAFDFLHEHYAGNEWTVKTKYYY
jgi:hypothetical protein